jgi:hypothetical protein
LLLSLRYTEQVGTAVEVSTLPARSLAKPLDVLTGVMCISTAVVGIFPYDRFLPNVYIGTVHVCLPTSLNAEAEIGRGVDKLVARPGLCAGQQTNGHQGLSVGGNAAGA